MADIIIEMPKISQVLSVLFFIAVEFLTYPRLNVAKLNIGHQLVTILNFGKGFITVF